METQAALTNEKAQNPYDHVVLPTVKEPKTVHICHISDCNRVAIRYMSYCFKHADERYKLK